MKFYCLKLASLLLLVFCPFCAVCRLLDFILSTHGLPKVCRESGSFKLHTCWGFQLEIVAQIFKYTGNDMSWKSVLNYLSQVICF